MKNDLLTYNKQYLILVSKPFFTVTSLQLCESSFLLLEYSIEYLIKYSNTNWYRMWWT